MKTTLTILFFLIYTIGTGQTKELKNLYCNYLEYCDEKIYDSVIQTGSIDMENTVPVYDNCGNIKAYKEIPGDTIWDKIQCPEYVNEYDGFSQKNSLWVRGGISLICDTINIWDGSHFYWRSDLKIRICTVKRKVECISKREKPTPEGFYIWLFNELKKEK